MDAREKIEAALAHLKERGVKPMTAAPPVWRLFWRLGVDVPPPHFLGFGPHTLLLGLLFLVPWLLCGGAFLMLVGAPVRWSFAVGGVFTALLFGALNAAHAHWRAARLGLPSWRDFDPHAEDRDDSW